MRNLARIVETKRLFVFWGQICVAGIWYALERLMEYSLFCHSLYACSSSPVKKKLFLLGIMFLLWVYMLYSCVGYCSGMPSLVVDSYRGKDTESSVGKRTENSRVDLMSRLMHERDYHVLFWESNMHVLLCVLFRASTVNQVC